MANINYWAHRSQNNKQELPSTITQEEATEILEADSSPDASIRRKLFLYEAMVDKYEHPFFMLRLANMLFFLKSPTMAMQHCIKVRFSNPLINKKKKPSY